MAANLPYPSIVFVPLDVLTAEELNQMAQNISYLAGLFPLASANIGNGAVKAINIDWGTMRKMVPDYASTSSTNIASNYQATITQTGFARVEVYGYNVGNVHRIELTVNNKLVWGMTQEAAASNGARSIKQSFVIPVSSGDVIKASSPDGGMQSLVVNMIPAKFV